MRKQYTGMYNFMAQKTCLRTLSTFLGTLANVSIHTLQSLSVYFHNACLQTLKVILRIFKC